MKIICKCHVQHLGGLSNINIQSVLSSGKFPPVYLNHLFSLGSFLPGEFLIDDYYAIRLYPSDFVFFLILFISLFFCTMFSETPRLSLRDIYSVKLSIQQHSCSSGYIPTIPLLMFQNPNSNFIAAAYVHVLGLSLIIQFSF